MADNASSTLNAVAEDLSACKLSHVNALKASNGTLKTVNSA